MIEGCVTADVGLLLVPAGGGFIASIQKGNIKANEIQGQSRQHARLLNIMGVKQLIVGINRMDAGMNKMDETGAYWSEKLYKEDKGRPVRSPYPRSRFSSSIWSHDKTGIPLERARRVEY